MAASTSSQPEIKRHASDSEHYAWNSKTAAREADLEALGAKLTPEKLSPKSARRAAEADNTLGGSPWNAAQTWEQRDCSKKALPMLEKRLRNGTSTDEEPALTVTAVDKCEGEVTAVRSRGKLRLGFEMNVKVEVEVDLEGDGLVTTVVGCDEVTDDSVGDWEWRVSLGTGQGTVEKTAKEQALRVVRKRCGSMMEKQILMWRDEIRELMS